MSTSSAEKGIVRIRGADAFTEVRVLDAHFKPVPLTANTGEVEMALTPGIYELGFRRGGAWRTQHLVLPTGATGLEVVAPDIEETGWSELPDLVEKRNVDPANLLVEIQDHERHLLSGSAADTIEVSLVGSDGSVTRPFYPTALVPGSWRFFAHTGHWRLRFGCQCWASPIDLPVTLNPGWAVQIVCPTVKKSSQASQESASAVTLDLERLRVRLIGADDAERGLSPAMLAHEESALASLAAARPLFGDSFQRLLRTAFRDKLKNPMMGIYAAHILAATEAGRAEPIDEILANLDRWTRRHPHEAFDHDIGPHPDVAALKLRFAMLQGQSLDEAEPIAFPPALLAGWNALLEAARLRPDLIPAGSVSEMVACRLVPSSLWVAWSEDVGVPVSVPAARAGEMAASPDSTPSPSFARARDLIISALSHGELREWYRHARAAILESDVPGAAAISDEMAAVAHQLRPILGKETNERTMMRASLSYPQLHRPGDAEAIAAVLALPVPTIAQAASSLATLFLDEGRRQGIDLERRTPMTRPEMIIPYDPNFLGDGFVVPMPTLTPGAQSAAFADGATIDYIHYSLVMHEERRVALFTANNIDAARKVSIPGGLTWQMDERVGEYQLGRETYESEEVDRWRQFDKGHLVRREDVLWGPVAEARAANKATYFYTNAAPQHENFNQDEWKSLEDWVLQRATDISYRLCVFTGPVLTDADPVLADLPPLGRMRGRAAPAQVPAAFWKIIILRDGEAGGGDLAAIAFAMKQHEMWKDKQGRRLLDLELHQVTIAAIEQWTGLDFGALKDVDELAFSPARSLTDEAPWPAVRSAADIIWSGAERRALGRRAHPVREARTAPAGRHSPIRASECCKEDFDARKAVEALGRDIARLTTLIAGQAADSSAPAPTRTLNASGPPAAESGVAADDPRVEAMVAAAPAAMKENIRAFAQTVVEQSDVARGLKPPAALRDLARIVGGQEVGRGGFPHCVCVGEPGQWMCTGALVAPRVVLTAAHCGGDIDRIAIGNLVSPNLGADTTVVPVQHVAVHPRYRPYPFSENDISILILASPALVPPIAMASDEAVESASAVELVGFGYNDPERPVGFGVKRQVRIDLPLILRKEGEDLSPLEQLLGFHADYEFVAGRKGLGRDSCNGDSGGPAYISIGNQVRLAGLTSRATREAVANCGDAGIYVRPTFFRSWIDGVVSSSGLPPIAW